MLENNLQNQMYAHAGHFGQNPTLIVMHPRTWIDLCIEVWANHRGSIYRHDPSLKYQGIRVLRSLDMVDGLFEVR
jgi:hypothetical protein